MASKNFIVCKQLVKAYRVSQHEIVALRGIDFEMQQGEMVAIIGPSGAGKSSLLNLLGGLDTPTAGQLTMDGQDLLALKGRRLAEYRLKKVSQRASRQSRAADHSRLPDRRLLQVQTEVTPSLPRGDEHILAGSG